MQKIAIHPSIQVLQLSLAFRSCGAIAFVATQKANGRNQEQEHRLPSGNT